MSLSFFTAYDPRANLETQVTNFDKRLLERLVQQGMLFYKHEQDGSCREVSVNEVVPDEIELEEFQLVEPVYVDERMNAVVDVFDALETLLCESSEVLSEGNTPRMAKASASLTPVQVFSEKLAALRAIAIESEE